MALEINIDTAKFVEIEKRINAQAKIALAGGDLKQEVGDFAVERIKYQARTTKPFNESGSFPALKDSTIKNRTYLAKYNPTHDTFAVDRSNLTITGEFLESLTWIDEGDTLLRLAFTGMHKFYVGAKGQRISKTIMNSTLAEYLAQKGFKPFDLSLEVNKQFITRIKTICQRYIRRALNISNSVADFDSQD